MSSKLVGVPFPRQGAYIYGIPTRAIISKGFNNISSEKTKTAKLFRLAPSCRFVHFGNIFQKNSSQLLRFVCTINIVIRLMFCIWFCIFMIGSVYVEWNWTMKCQPSGLDTHFVCKTKYAMIMNMKRMHFLSFFFSSANEQRRRDFNFTELKLNFLDFTYKMLPHLIDRFDCNVNKVCGIFCVWKNRLFLFSWKRKEK